MKKTPFVIATLVAIFLLPLSSALAAPPKPNQVIGYSADNLQGAATIWEIPTGYRHFLVRSTSHSGQPIRSIAVGSGVRVKLFGGENFSSPLPPPVEPGKTLNIGGSGSLIVFPAQLPEPLGITLEGRTTGNIKVYVGSFYPLPESVSLLDICHQVDSIWQSIPMQTISLHGKNLKAELYYRGDCSGESMVLENDPAISSFAQTYDPSQSPLHYIQKQVRSIRLTLPNMFGALRPKSPKLEAIKGTVLPGGSVIPEIAGVWRSNLNATYTIEQQQNQATWRVAEFQQTATITVSGKKLTAVYQDGFGVTQTVHGTITGMTGNMALRIEWDNNVVFTREVKLDDDPDATWPAGKVGLIVDVAGTWLSSAGLTYLISQQGSTIAWTVVNSDEQGAGTIKGKGLSVSYKGTAGQGQLQGVVSQVDANNKAQEIRWLNGITFQRQ